MRVSPAARTSPQVAEKAAPTLYSTRLRQAAARAMQLSPAIRSTALASHLYSRHSVLATTFLHGHGKLTLWTSTTSNAEWRLSGKGWVL